MAAALLVLYRRVKGQAPFPCLSVLGGLQPGPLERYLREVFGGRGNDGLLQRFELAVWPDGSGPWRNVDRWPDATDGWSLAARFSLGLEQTVASDLPRN